MLNERQHQFMKLVQIADAKMNINEMFDLSQKAADCFPNFDSFVNTFWQLERMEYVNTNDVHHICFMHPKGYQYLNDVLKEKKHERMKRLHEYWQFKFGIVVIILTIIAILISLLK